MKKIWVSWERHRRTVELVGALNDVSLKILESDADRIIRYPYLLLRTLILLLQEQPGLVIIQNPSVVLSLFMVTLGKAMTKGVVVDAHNEGLKPFHYKYSWLLPLYRFIQRKADLTIVTNSNLADVVSRNGGRPFVLEDRIPRFNHPTKTNLNGEAVVTFVCTFEKDEPFMEVIHSAQLLSPSVSLYITGSLERIPHAVIESAPSNVKFTGYLSDNDYENLLYSSDVIMDLTLMEDCLVCGAYEAVALGKPMILSNTNAIKDYFNKGAVYTDNNPHAIAAAIQQAIDYQERLQDEAAELGVELTSQWDVKFLAFKQALDQIGRLQ